MPKSEVKRFDHHYRDFQQDGAAMQKHSQRGIKEIRLAKTCAYRMATSYVRMIEKDQAKLVDMVKTSEQTVDEWLDEWFKPLQVIDPDYRALLTAVAKGMTLKKYLSTTPGVFLSAKRRESVGQASAPVPSIPDSKLSVEERLEQWIARAKAYEVQLRDERKLRKESDRRVAELEATVKRLHQILDKVAV